MITVNSYLTFDGNCEEAFNFYKSVFGGEYSHLGRFKEMQTPHPLPASEQEKIMHVSLPISKETVLMGSDASMAMGQKVTAGDNIALSVNTETEADAIRIFEKLSEGGKVTMPLDKTFWGALFGMFTDKFGINWMVNYDYPKQ